jgi:hypothetical protein
MAADKRKPDIPDEVIESLARMLLPAIQKYFDSEEGQREFAAWKAEKEIRAWDNPIFDVYCIASSVGRMQIAASFCQYLRQLSTFKTYF